MFQDETSVIGDNLLYPMVLMGKYLRKMGHKFSTIDMDDITKFDKIIFLDYPTMLNSYFRKLLRLKHKELYLVLLESEMIRPDNFILSNHKPFKKVFTWKTNLIDNKKYINLHLANKIEIDKGAFNPLIKKGLFTMIASHKYNDHPLELYSERIKAIKWFEINHPEEFDLYGIGWDRVFFRGKLHNLNPLLNKLYKKMKFLPKFNLFPSYKGPLKSKRDILKKYRYSISYENASIPGYISEKIIDCLLAGSVPIYLGAPDIQNFIPLSCFIDKRSFKSYNELYNYAKNMSTKEYNNYLENIYNFINSDNIKLFSAETFVKKIISEILK